MGKGWAPGHPGPCGWQAGWPWASHSASDLHSLGSRQTSGTLLHRWLHVPELLACVTLLAPGHGAGSCLRPLTAEGDALVRAGPSVTGALRGVLRGAGGYPQKQVPSCPAFSKACLPGCPLSRPGGSVGCGEMRITPSQMLGTLGRLHPTLLWHVWVPAGLEPWA